MRIVNLPNSHKYYQFFLFKTLPNVFTMISYLAELPQVFKGSIHPELSRRVGICENLKMVFIIINDIIMIMTNLIISVHVRAPV